MRHALFTVTLALLAVGLTGCLDPSVRGAKGAVTTWGSYLSAGKWNDAGNMMDASFEYQLLDGRRLTGQRSRQGYIAFIKDVGGTLILHIKDASKKDADNVIVQVEFQARVGDATKPANLFWKSAVSCKKIGDQWKIVKVTEITKPDKKTGY